MKDPWSTRKPLSGHLMRIFGSPPSPTSYWLVLHCITEFKMLAQCLRRDHLCNYYYIWQSGVSVRMTSSTMMNFVFHSVQVHFLTTIRIPFQMYWKICKMYSMVLWVLLPNLLLVTALLLCQIVSTKSLSWFIPSTIWSIRICCSFIFLFSTK